MELLSVSFTASSRVMNTDVMPEELACVDVSEEAGIIRYMKEFVGSRLAVMGREECLRIYISHSMPSTLTSVSSR